MLAITISPSGVEASPRRARFTLRESAELHVGTYSGEGARVAGGLVIALGWAAAIGGAIGYALPGATCTGCISLFAPGALYLFATLVGLAIGVPLSILGGVLLGFGDHTYVDVVAPSERRRVSATIEVVDGGAIVDLIAAF